MIKNVSGSERLVSFALGSLALNQSMSSKRSALLKLGLVGLGLGLLWRGTSGSCPLYKQMNLNTLTHLPKAEKSHPENSVLVNKPLEELRKLLLLNTIPYAMIGAGLRNDEFKARVGKQDWILQLEAAKDGRRTFIKRTIEPAGALGKLSLAKFLPMDSFDLRKLKALLETGEIATIQGQSHGQRSGLGKAVEKLSQGGTDFGQPGSVNKDGSKLKEVRA